jgi:hypothetical protein
MATVNEKETNNFVQVVGEDMSSYTQYTTTTTCTDKTWTIFNLFDYDLPKTILIELDKELSKRQELLDYYANLEFKRLCQIDKFLNQVKMVELPI